MTKNERVIVDDDYNWIDTETGEYLEIDDLFNLVNQLNDEVRYLRFELDTHKHPLWSTREAESKIKECKRTHNQFKQHIRGILQNEYEKTDVPVWRRHYIREVAKQLGFDLNETML